MSSGIALLPMFYEGLIAFLSERRAVIFVSSH